MLGLLCGHAAALVAVEVDARRAKHKLAAVVVQTTRVIADSEADVFGINVGTSGDYIVSYAQSERLFVCSTWNET